MNKYIISLMLVLSFLGLVDASYLTYEHFNGNTPACNYSTIQLIDCGNVLKSEYAYILGIPLSLIGMFHYFLLMFWVIGVIFSKIKFFRIFIVLQSIAGFVFSVYLVIVQLLILKSICLYCMGSAIISSLFFIIILFWKRSRKESAILITSIFYKYLLKPILFKFEPELIHETMVNIGNKVGSMKLITWIVVFLYKLELPSLTQEIKKIKFDYPIGLSAGFDYNADLTQSLKSWGFGFQTVGTITNLAYEGNVKPRLGRLPKSKSLLVNKGFKNLGSEVLIGKLQNLIFEIPVGISIGRTNSQELCTQEASVGDIILAFSKFKKSKIKHSFYELNISCPNLYGNVEFYSVPNLKQLLIEIDKLKLDKPVFIKMPIDKSEKETLEMLKIICEHKITGVIFGNLQKNREHPSFNKVEISKIKQLKGNFSGKPTFDQSNQLIKLSYKYFHKQLIIIGCGGVFDAHDAYEKIKNGASLVQMITGMIYNGPQSIMKINLELDELLQKDGYKHISEAIGVNVK